MFGLYLELEAAGFATAILSSSSFSEFVVGAALTLLE
jgi:hypothetical protein